MTLSWSLFFNYLSVYLSVFYSKASLQICKVYRFYKFYPLVFAVCCVGSGLCDELISRSREDLPHLACRIVCDLETSTMRRPGNEWGCCTSELSCISTIATDFPSGHFKWYDNVNDWLISISIIGEVGNPCESYAVVTRFRVTPTMLATRSVINDSRVPDRTWTYVGVESFTNRFHSRQHDDIHESCFNWRKLDGIFR